MAAAVSESLNGDRILMVEAGTGVGKTLAYMLPLLHFALTNDTRVVISTETRSLQEQILKKDLPIAQKLLGAHIQAEVCLGSSNYVCKRKLNEALNSGTIDPRMGTALQPFLDWEATTTDGIRHEYNGRTTPLFWKQTTRDPDQCLANRCPYYRESYYFVAREKWRNAHLLIVNHSLLAAHYALEARLLPPFAHLVVDESHRFPEIFHEAFVRQIDCDELQMLIHEGQPLNLQEQKQIDAFRNDLLHAFTLKEGERSRLTVPFQASSTDAILKLLTERTVITERSLDDLRSQQDLGMDAGETVTTDVRVMELNARLARLKEVRSIIDSFAAGPRPNQVLWIQNPEGGDGQNYRMHAAPLRPGPLFSKYFYPEIQSTIFTSATLTGTGTRPFTYFAGEIGLRDTESAAELRGRVSTRLLASPFDFPGQAILYLPPTLPDPSMQEDAFHEQVAIEIQHLIALTGGGAFILFTSTRSLRAVDRVLRRMHGDHNLLDADGLPIEWINQLDAGAAVARRRFLEAERAVLLGLASFWQGIDVAGDRLRLVVLVRLPFRVPDEPILAARMETEKAAGREPFRTIQLPQATLAMKQGFGRLIRSQSDTGIVAILDPRVQTRRYGKEILDALPPARRVGNQSDLLRAYREVRGRKARL
ncbi:MAG: DEAD/DEAH box helicase [Leptospiraceae bacterium]|nr:DEAD/DEAH box helicase [Leptospiraceae bacterium]MCB1315568.1 DEAD/DEAH box helicase [Leptospiraceae bacterium]MCB1319524.1 DEAD/DEAH box helicase [Leptospiraceae bacterium]